MDQRFRWSLATLLLLSLPGCDLAGDIFEAGFWIGAIVVLLILALVIWAVFQLFD